MLNLFKKKTLTEPVFPGENYSILKCNFDDGWGLVTVNSAYKNYPNKQFFPYCGIITIELENVNENGHPIDEEAGILETIEERITEFLKNGRMVHFLARVNRNSYRDLLYYFDNMDFNSNNTKIFFDSINELRNVNFEIIDDDKWESVSEFLQATV